MSTIAARARRSRDANGSSSSIGRACADQNASRQAICSDAGRVSVSGASARAAASAASIAGREAPAPHSPASASSRSSSPRYRASLSARSSALTDSRVTSPASLANTKCGDRSSATSAPREKRDDTASRTRSSAADVGSAASGSASDVWYGMPARRKISAAAYRYGSGCLKTTAVRSSGTASPRRRSAFSCRATATSSSSRSRNVHHGSSVGASGGVTSTGFAARLKRLAPTSPRVDLLEPGPPVVQPLVEAGGEHALGRHDVERLEARDARQQIEVGLVEPFGVGNPVGDRDDDVADRIGGRLRDQPLAQRVLVAAARLAHAPLVVAERVGEKPRLRAHAAAPRDRRSSDPSASSISSSNRFTCCDWRRS